MEVVLQGHALFTRQAGGDLPCPALDFTGGFNQFMAAAYNLTGKTIEQVYGAPFGASQPLRHAYVVLCWVLSKYSGFPISFQDGVAVLKPPY